MDVVTVILAIIILPILGLVFLLAGSFIRQIIFKVKTTDTSFGNSAKSIIIGLIFFIVIGIVFKGCYRNNDNDNTIDYDGK